LKKIDNNHIGGLILAGGKSRRMNFFDKSFKKIQKKTLIDLVLNKARKQVFDIAINSNSLSFTKKDSSLELLEDIVPGQLGPLAGILTGLEWIKKKKLKWLVTFPVDSPFFPENLVEIFFSNLDDEKIIIAKSNERIHPVFSMWNIELIEPLKKALDKNIRKIDEFTKNFKFKVVNFPIIDYDPFFNINNEEDLLKAEHIYELILEQKIRG